jgi:hypothetical protein
MWRIRFCQTILILTATTVFGHPYAPNPESVFPILMPRVRPRLPEGESYLCTAVETDPDRTLYVTEIEPSDLAKETAHHLVKFC